MVRALLQRLRRLFYCRGRAQPQDPEVVQPQDPEVVTRGQVAWRRLVRKLQRIRRMRKLWHCLGERLKAFVRLR